MKDLPEVVQEFAKVEAERLARPHRRCPKDARPNRGVSGKHAKHPVCECGRDEEVEAIFNALLKMFRLGSS